MIAILLCLLSRGQERQVYEGDCFPEPKYIHVSALQGTTKTLRRTCWPFKPKFSLSELKSLPWRSFERSRVTRIEL